MWFNYFDSIFLINLPDRRDRYLISAWELAKYSVPYETVRAVRHPDGREGLYQTTLQISRTAVAKGYQRILIFEDDLKIMGPLDTVAEKCIAQLPPDWDLFYLGCNLAQRPARFFSDNLLPVTRALSTHAVAYSRPCIEKILSLPKCLPIDQLLVDAIQPAGRSYCSCPFVVTQYPGFSNIENRHTDYGPFLDQRFAEHVTPLIQVCQEEKVTCCRA